MCITYMDIYLHANPQLENLNFSFSGMDLIYDHTKNLQELNKLICTITNLTNLKKLQLLFNGERVLLLALKAFSEARFEKSLNYLTIDIDGVEINDLDEYEASSIGFLQRLENLKSLMLVPPDVTAPTMFKKFCTNCINLFFSSEKADKLISTISRVMKRLECLYYSNARPFCNMKQIINTIRFLGTFGNLRSLLLVLNADLNFKFSTHDLSQATKNCFSKAKNLNELLVKVRGIRASDTFKLFSSCTEVNNLCFIFDRKYSKEGFFYLDKEGARALKQMLTNMKKLGRFSLLASFTKLPLDDLREIFDFVGNMRLKHCELIEMSYDYWMDEEDFVALQKRMLKNLNL